MKIIMNPPYNGNLHLKILSKVIEVCKAAEARIAKEELENSKKVELPKTGFIRFI